MRKDWMVVANASRARVLQVEDEPGVYTHVADLVHPESRLKGEQLGNDRPGRVEGSGHGLGSASYVPRTDPREREHERFAREVAEQVNRGVADGRCGGVTLVASDPFLGQVKSHLGVQAHKLLQRTLAADYTTLSDKELARRLATTA